MKNEKALTNDEIVAILEKTPLGGFIDLLKSGKFNPPSEAVVPNDVVIGELTFEERAMHGVLSSLNKKAKEIADANNEMVRIAQSKDEPVDELRVFLNRAEVEATMGTIHCLREVMWHSIKRRIGAPANERDAIGIRSGFKVVSFDKAAEESDLLELMAAIGGNLFVGRC